MHDPETSRDTWLFIKFHQKPNGPFNSAKIKNLAVPSPRIGSHQKLCVARFSYIYHLRVPLTVQVDPSHFASRQIKACDVSGSCMSPTLV